MLNLKKGDFVVVSMEGEQTFLRLSGEMEEKNDGVFIPFDHIWKMHTVPRLVNGQSVVGNVLEDLGRNLSIGEGVFTVPVNHVPAMIAAVKPDGEIYNALMSTATGITIPR